MRFESDNDEGAQRTAIFGHSLIQMKKSRLNWI